MNTSLDLEDLVAVPTKSGVKVFGMSGAYYRKAFQTGKLRRFRLGSRVFFSKREMTALITVSRAKEEEAA